MEFLPIFENNKIKVDHKNFYLIFYRNDNTKCKWCYNKLDLLHWGKYKEQSIKLYFESLTIIADNNKISFIKANVTRSYSFYKNKKLNNNFYSAIIKNGQVVVYISNEPVLFFNSKDYNTNEKTNVIKEFSYKNDIKFISCGLFHFYNKNFIVKNTIDFNVNYLENHLSIKFYKNKLKTCLHENNFSIFAKTNLDNQLYSCKLNIKDLIFNVKQLNKFMLQTNNCTITLSAQDNVIYSIVKYYKNIIKKYC